MKSGNRDLWWFATSDMLLLCYHTKEQDRGETVWMEGRRRTDERRKGTDIKENKYI